MELTKVRCARYKAFREPVEIEIRPLTVFLGKNNAGKSALVRLIMLLLDSFVSRSRLPLELHGAGVEHGNSLDDLIYGHIPGRQAHGSIELGASFVHDGEIVNIDTTIQQVSRAMPQPASDEYAVVSSWKASGALEQAFTWTRTPDQPPRYHEEENAEFRGLWPRAINNGNPSWRSQTAPWRQRVDDLRGYLSYVGPLRPLVPRVLIRAEPRGFSNIAAEAPQWLAGDEHLRRRVSQWYATHLDGWELGIDRAGSAFHCILRRGEVAVNLAGAGEGMAQVLPVVVQQMLAVATGDAPRLCLVEQPELHLHPAAHGAVADLLVDSAERTGVRTVVETHSENFLLRLRRRVAERRLLPEQVALYWVDESDGASTVKELEIYPDGELSYWPEGVFSESYDEVLALRRAARARRAPENG